MCFFERTCLTPQSPSLRSQEGRAGEAEAGTSDKSPRPALHLLLVRSRARSHAHTHSHCQARVRERVTKRVLRAMKENMASVDCIVLHEQLQPLSDLLVGASTKSAGKCAPVQTVPARS